MSYLAKTPEDLLPCPHCGGEAKEFTGEDAAPHRWTVECDRCGAHVGSDTRNKARAKWNRRAERTCLAKPYEVDGETGFYDCIECECGEVNDVSARYCNGCGGLIEVVHE